MRIELLVALLLAGAFGCERTPKSGRGGENAATLAVSGEDRSFENDGCAIDFAYRKPYYTRDDGFRPLRRVRDATPSEITIDSTSTSSGVPGVAIDEAGRVFRYSDSDAGPAKYLLVGQVEGGVLRRVLASRQPAAMSALGDFAPPNYCYDVSGGAEIRVYGTDPSLRAPVLLASAGSVSARRRVSQDADALIRWMLAVRGRALAVPPYCDTNPHDPECFPEGGRL